MSVYLTIRGEAIPLSALKDEERLFLERCRQKWRKMGFARFTADCLHGTDAPLPSAEPGHFQGVNLLEYPLFLILFDMHWRLKVEEGEALPHPDDDLRDPFREAGPVHTSR